MQSLKVFGLIMALALAARLAAAPLTGTVTAVDGVAPLLTGEQLVHHVPKATVRPVIDGKADEWVQIPALVLDRKEQARGWKGPEDQRGTLRLQWDEQGLYFYLEVVDDVHAAPNAKSDWWMNDACQFAFDAYMNGPKGFDADEHSYLIGDSPEGPLFVAYRMPGANYERERVVPGRVVKMTAGDNGNRTFEWMMTWDQLAPVSPWVLGRCGFSYCLNDNDGKGFKGAMFWTKGLIYGQDASQFGQLVFDGAQGSRAGVLGLRPELKVTGAESDSYWLNVPGVDPWGSARLLVANPAGGPVTASAAIFRPGEKKPVAEGTLTGEVPAGKLAAFQWNTSGLRDGVYDVVFTVKKPWTAIARTSCYQLHLDLLRARLFNFQRACAVNRPWETLDNAPARLRKHRGLVAAAGEKLQPARVEAALRDNDLREGYLRDLAEIAVMLDALESDRDYLAGKRGVFMGAYYSAADGSGQPFPISLPENFNPNAVYPLVVHLHGAGGVPGPGDAGQANGMTYIKVMPWGRGGSTGFRALGEDDVLRIIDYMTTWYRIDLDRIYLAGASQGGWGGWRFASRYPGLFAAAAPMCGSADGLPLENLRNIPILDQHGAKDWMVPVDFSRYAVQKLQGWNYPVLYKEIPDSEHSISGIYPDIDWLLAKRRVSKPATITFTTHRVDAPGNRAYWLAVRQLVDPHVPARVDAAVSGSGAQQSVSLALENVAVLELDTAAMPIDGKARLLVQADFAFLEQPGPLPEKLYLVKDGDNWAVRSVWLAPERPMRPYCAGGLRNLYAGEPLLVVYGTRGDAARDTALKTIGESLARFGGSSNDEDMPAGGFPVKSDLEITAEDMTRSNLLLVGGPRDNAVAAMVAPRLPFVINDKNELEAGGRRPISLTGGILQALYYNPLAPQRLLYLFAPDDPAKITATRRDIRNALYNPWTDALGDIADLAVTGPAGARRLMQFTDDWQWMAPPDDEVILPVKYQSRKNTYQADMRAMRRLANADFALNYDLPAKDDPTFPDEQWLTWTDAALVRTPLTTVVSPMTGAELAEIYNQFIVKEEMAAWPAFMPKDLDPARTYQVVMTTSFMRYLAIKREHNLTTPRIGPAIPPEELVRERIQ